MMVHTIYQTNSTVFMYENVHLIQHLIRKGVPAVNADSTSYITLK